MTAFMPNNQTVSEFIAPQIATAYTTGRMPDLLPALPEHEPEHEG